MMNIDAYIGPVTEEPLDRILTSGGLTMIFRNIACIGDSLSSGEFEAFSDEGEHSWHDRYEYSWGQHIARMCGSTVYNFSCGGMSAKWYMETFADERDLWNPDKKAEAYILALGCNDINQPNFPGCIDDVDPTDWHNNKETFAGYYAQIIARYKEIAPKAKFFLMTMPQEPRWGEERQKMTDEHAALLYQLADLFDYTYVIDLRKYGPVYDQNFMDKFFLYGHLNPAGYVLTAQMVISYIDYIIRKNPTDFTQAGYISMQEYYSDSLEKKLKAEGKQKK